MTQAHLVVSATDRSPQVDFNHEAGVFLMRGESYPEDAARFFGGILMSVHQFFRDRPQAAARVEIELSYFNSSSAKALMNLFQAFESAAANGADVVINWHYLENDFAMREFGEDFAMDFEHCTFNIRADTAA